MSNHRNRTRRNKCDTGKTRYRDHKEATDSLRHFGHKSAREEVPCRAYKCLKCGGWHVTSKELGHFGWDPKDNFERFLAMKVKERFGE